jgi:hypothetical protein
MITSNNNRDCTNHVRPEVLLKAREKFKEMSDKQKKELRESLSWFFLTDSLKKKIRLNIQTKMKKMDIISLILAALGVLTNAMASFFYIDFEKKQVEGNSNSNSNSNYIITYFR